MENLKSFPPGPLTPFRETSSFDWKTLKLFLEGDDEDVLDFKYKIWRYMETQPEFARSHENETLDAKRRRCMNQIKCIVDQNIASDDDILSNPMKVDSRI
jgi:acyl-CoA oxidase